MIGNTLARASAGIGSLSRATSNYIGGSLSGVAKAGGIGLSVGLTFLGDDPDHGAGYAVAKGLAYAHPATFLPLVGLDIASAALSFGNNYNQSRKKLEMFSPVPDLYGNVSTMRQRSLNTIDRGRAALGQEARLLR